MIKLNNKGFMMAEVVVVSSIVLAFLTTIFVSYNKMYATYLTRIGYYDVTTLYRLGYYRDILIENNKLTSILSENNDITSVYGAGSSDSLFNLPDSEKPDSQEDRVYLIKTKDNNHYINVNALDGTNVNETFKDYMKYLSNSVTPRSNYIMVMERCNIKSGTLNTDDCKYAYLEIYDGNE